MKKTYIIVIVLILIILGIWFFGMNKQVVAPVLNNDQTTSVGNGDTSVVPNINVDTTVTTTSAPVKEFIVTGQNFSFTPSTITVKKGDKVKITFNNTSGFHNFVIDAYGVATKASQSPDTEILEFTANKVGSFEYYCSVGSHRAMGMRGTLKVE